MFKYQEFENYAGDLNIKPSRKLCSYRQLRKGPCG